MKAIILLILVLSAVLMVSCSTEEASAKDFSPDAERASSAEVMNEANDGFLEEGDDVEIGEMI